jgi:hypothetical protein
MTGFIHSHLTATTVTTTVRRPQTHHCLGHRLGTDSVTCSFSGVRNDVWGCSLMFLHINIIIIINVVVLSPLGTAATSGLLYKPR